VKRPPASDALGSGVLLTSSFNAGQDAESHQHQRPHHNPVCRYVHQACPVDKPGNHDDKTGQVDSE